MTEKKFEIIIELLQKIHTELYNSNNSLRNRRVIRSKKF